MAMFTVEDFEGFLIGIMDLYICSQCLFQHAYEAELMLFWPMFYTSTTKYTGTQMYI